MSISSAEAKATPLAWVAEANTTNTKYSVAFADGSVRSVTNEDLQASLHAMKDVRYGAGPLESTWSFKWNSRDWKLKIEEDGKATLSSQGTKASGRATFDKEDNLSLKLEGVTANLDLSGAVTWKAASRFSLAAKDGTIEFTSAAKGG